MTSPAPHQAAEEKTQAASGTECLTDAAIRLRLTEGAFRYSNFS